MKAIFLIALIIAPQCVFAQTKVQVGDSVIIARIRISPDGSMNCQGAYITAYFNSSEFGKTNPDSSGYDFNIYFKPAYPGIRYDTCYVHATCLDVEPPYDFKFYTERFPLAVLAVADTSSGLTPIGSNRPAALRLASDGASITLEAIESINARLEVFDILGHTKQVIPDRMFLAGIYNFPLDLEAGIYFIRLESTSYREIRKLFVHKRE